VRVPNDRSRRVSQQENGAALFFVRGDLIGVRAESLKTEFAGDKPFGPVITGKARKLAAEVTKAAWVFSKRRKMPYALAATEKPPASRRRIWPPILVLKSPVSVSPAGKLYSAFKKSGIWVLNLYP
jgi:hypothetical protein